MRWVVAWSGGRTLCVQQWVVASGHDDEECHLEEAIFQMHRMMLNIMVGGQKTGIVADADDHC